MKRTALHHQHQSAGVIWANRHGWEIPAFFLGAEQEAAHARTGVGISDTSYLQKFEIQEVQPDSWKLGSKRYLVIGEPPIGGCPGGWDITSVYSAFRLIGPKSRDVLRKLTSLNVSDSSLPSHSCGQANVAHVHTILLREDLGMLLSYTMLISREYSESVWESVRHAGREFNIVPLGVDAVDLLR
jgi:glycine cleavage system aminomethyltransferase T